MSKAPESLSPPWPASASVLVAFAALAINEDASAKAAAGVALVSVPAVAPIVFAAVAILISLLTRVRMQRGSSTIWIVRLLVTAALFLYAVGTAEHIQSFYYMNFVARVAALCFVSESALQHWQRPPAGQPRGAVLVFLAAIIFAMASRTYVHGYVKFLSPPFVVLLALSMRASRTRVARPGDGLHPWIAALFLATALGGLAALAISQHSIELTRLLLSVLKPASYNDYSEANTHPRLAGSFNEPLSQKRMFRVEGQLVERHLRGMTFDTYIPTGAWGSTLEPRGREDAALSLKARPGGERLIVTPLIDNITVLHVPLHMAGIDAKSYRLTWAREGGGPIYASTGSSTPQPYQIAIANDTFNGPLCSVMSDAIRANCLEQLDPRILEIARAIGAGIKNPRDKLEALRIYLYRNHSYSLAIDPGSGDPVVNFLTEKKDGHCQYFAASAVLLARAMGFPARYVTGFYAHESAEPGITLVRQRDAHAWAEVWIDDPDGGQWETFDATPSSGMPGQSGSISFWERLWEKLGDMAESAGAWLRESPMSKLGLLAGVIIGVIIAFRWVRSWLLSTRPADPAIQYASPGRALETMATAFDNWFRRSGVPCPPERPWPDHLAILKKEMLMEKTARPPIDWKATEAFVKGYSQARFGGIADAEAIQRLNEQLRLLTK